MREVFYGQTGELKGEEENTNEARGYRWRQAARSRRRCPNPSMNDIKRDAERTDYGCEEQDGELGGRSLEQNGRVKNGEQNS